MKKNNSNLILLNRFRKCKYHHYVWRNKQQRWRKVNIKNCDHFKDGGGESSFLSNRGQNLQMWWVWRARLETDAISKVLCSCRVAQTALKAAAVQTESDETLSFPLLPVEKEGGGGRWGGRRRRGGGRKNPHKWWDLSPLGRCEGSTPVNVQMMTRWWSH